MKKKYRILEKHYSDGSVWYFPQMGDWWHGWRYICTRHVCPDIGPNTTKEVFKSYEDAEKYLEDLVSRLNNPDPVVSKLKCWSAWCVETKVHNFDVDKVGCS
jgi:hypothetical protein